MELKPLLAIVVLVAVASVLLRWLNRWWIRRAVRRLVGEVTEGKHKETRLVPESLYVVELTERGVLCRDPQANVEKVDWDDLTKVEIVTNDHGPFLPDCFWVLHGTQSGCVVPWGATGEKELIARLQSLAGFDNGAVIRAAPSTSWNRFLCWEKTAQAVGN